MNATPTKPITDSPWFWVRLFSGVAMVGLVAMMSRYQMRQGQIERRFEARHNIVERGGESVADEDFINAEPLDEVNPSISLMPLVIVAGGMFLAASVAMQLERRNSRRAAAAQTESIERAAPIAQPNNTSETRP